MIVEPLHGRAILKDPSSRDGEELRINIRGIEIDPALWPTVSRYCRASHQEWRFVRKDRLRIRVPDGIGDLHWIFLKLQSLRDLCGAKEIILCKQRIPKKRDYYGRSERADDFVKMNPTVTELVEARDLIGLPASGYLIDVLGYDYVLNPNTVMELGHSFEDWLPEVPTNYTYKLNLPPRREDSHPLVYFGDRYAEVTWAGNWHDKQWAGLVNAYKEKYGTPLTAIGLSGDMEKAESIACSGGDFVNLVGKTSLSEVLALLLSATMVIGSISGLTILSAAWGFKTLAFWPDKGSLNELPNLMRTSWMPKSLVGVTYFPLGYSSLPRQVIDFVKGDIPWITVREKS